jgi:hypothetical protein
VPIIVEKKARLVPPLGRVLNGFLYGELTVFSEEEREICGIA